MLVRSPYRFNLYPQKIIQIPSLEGKHAVVYSDMHNKNAN